MEQMGAKRELIYVEGRPVDAEIDDFLRSDDEYNLSATLFMPPRTGKTTAVRAGARRNGFDLHRHFLGSLYSAVKQMVAEGSGEYNKFINATADLVTFSMLGVPNNVVQALKKKKKKVLLHFDEVQEYADGIDYFRTQQFDFRNAPPAARFAALVHHVRLLCGSNVRLVVSGTALDVGRMLKLSSSDKFRTICIQPTSSIFVRKVLREQKPACDPDDATCEQLSGHVGQLLHYHNAWCMNEETALEEAFRTWFEESQNRLQWGLEDVLNASLFFAALASQNIKADKQDGLICVPAALVRSTVYEKAKNDGAWVTVCHVPGLGLPRVAPLSPWQEKALNKLYSESQTLLHHAFIIDSSAGIADPNRQKGFVFQILFALELCCKTSPLWSQLNLQPTPFVRYERFDADRAWEDYVLYVVRESSAQKVGDIVFRDSGTNKLVVLELKCGEPDYVWAQYADYAKKLGTPPDGEQHYFVSCQAVDRLSDPAKDIRKLDGNPDKRCKTLRPPVCTIVNGASKLATEYILHPEMDSKSTVAQFTNSITRTDARAKPIVEAATGRRRGREEEHHARAEKEDEFIVTDGTATFPVTPSKPTVMHLKKAIKAEIESNTDGKVNAFTITIITPHGKVMGDEDALEEGNTYVFKLPK